MQVPPPLVLCVEKHLHGHATDLCHVGDAVAAALGRAFQGRFLGEVVQGVIQGEVGQRCQHGRGRQHDVQHGADC